MILVGILTSLFIYFGDGPFWTYTDPTGFNPSLYDACKDHWWTNLLYVNNIVYPVNQVVCVLFCHCTQYRCTLYGFKIALKVFDCSRGRCPKYFGDVYTPVHTVAARLRLRSADHGDLVDQWTTKTSSFHVCSPPDLAAAVFVCVVRQFATNFHRICEAQTPETV